MGIERAATGGNGPKCQQTKSTQSPAVLVGLTRSQKLRIDATADGYVNQQTIFKE